MVDDEQDIVTTLTRNLQSKGFEVDSFTDPKQALSSYKEHYYDDIILDVRMPEMDGFQLAREIWKRDNDANICFFTAFEIYEQEARKVFPTLKKHCFITKPVATDNLIKHIHAHSQQQ
jgi:two-component system catabolic regulation response regulator CreB/two-component system response regulator ChvI